MPDTKKKVIELLDRLPDECTIEEVLYHLYVLDSVEKGIAEADAGRVISHEQVAQELRSKWVQGRAE